MKKHQRLFGGWLCLLLLLLVFHACGSGNGRTDAYKDVKQDTNHIIIQVKDSTLYGVAGDCGMSTFCLITDDGDTILVSRNSEDGTYGTIIGDLILGNRFCMTPSPDKTFLLQAINVTQLMEFLPNCRVLNGKVFLPGSNRERADTLTILSLSADSLVYCDHLGKKYICR